MEFHQVVRLIKNDRGHCALIEETRDDLNRLISYKYLEGTPIHPSSKHYKLYLQKKIEDSEVSEVIKRMHKL